MSTRREISLGHELLAAHSQAHQELEWIEVLISEAHQHLEGDPVNAFHRHASRRLLCIAQHLIGQFIDESALAADRVREMQKDLSPEVEA